VLKQKVLLTSCLGVVHRADLLSVCLFHAKFKPTALWPAELGSYRSNTVMRHADPKFGAKKATVLRLISERTLPEPDNYLFAAVNRRFWQNVGKYKHSLQRICPDIKLPDWKNKTAQATAKLRKLQAVWEKGTSTEACKARCHTTQNQICDAWCTSHSTKNGMGRYGGTPYLCNTSNGTAPSWVASKQTCLCFKDRAQHAKPPLTHRPPKLCPPISSATQELSIEARLMQFCDLNASLPELKVSEPSMSTGRAMPVPKLPVDGTKHTPSAQELNDLRLEMAKTKGEVQQLRSTVQAVLELLGSSVGKLGQEVGSLKAGTHS
jgi:hypothetical protein